MTLFCHGNCLGRDNRNDRLHLSFLDRSDFPKEDIDSGLFPEDRNDFFRKAVGRNDLKMAAAHTCPMSNGQMMVADNDL